MVQVRNTEAGSSVSTRRMATIDARVQVTNETIATPTRI